MAAKAPLGSSELGARTFKVAADFALGSGLAESPGGTGAFISGFGRADMAESLWKVCFSRYSINVISLVKYLSTSGESQINDFNDNTTI